MSPFSTRANIADNLKIHEELRQEIEALQDPVYTTNNDITWSIDANKEAIRRAIGKSFAGTASVKGEPLFEWGLNHVQFDAADEKEQAVRFMTSHALMDDWKESSFQLCALQLNEDDNSEKENSNKESGSIVAFASVQEYDAEERARRETYPKTRLVWNHLVTTLQLATAFKEPLPKHFLQQPKDLKRLEGKLPNFEYNRACWHREVGPKGMHWYVHLVGVVPDHHGKGRGKQLMTMLNTLADQQQKAMLLECGDYNRGFYENMGYRVVMTQSFVDPQDDDDPFQMHMMVREPNNKTM